MQSPTSLKARVEGALRFLLLFLVLFPSLLLCNVVQTLSLLVLPFSRRLVRKINRWLADTWWGLCVTATVDINHTIPVFSGDELPQKENAIVLANHQQMPDIIALFSLGKRQGRLGDMKWFVKEFFKYFPGIGWGLSFLDAIFLKRNWESDRTLIESMFSKFRREGIPMWLVSFPEGTRITPSKFEKSRQYATQHNRVPPEYSLVPRTKGFVASVRGLREHIQAVYIVTIGYPEGIPNLTQWIKGWPKSYHVHTRRYPIASIPVKDEELSQWLLLRFQEVDGRLKKMYTTGRF